MRSSESLCCVTENLRVEAVPLPRSSTSLSGQVLARLKNCRDVQLVKQTVTVAVTKRLHDRGGKAIVGLRRVADLSHKKQVAFLVLEMLVEIERKTIGRLNRPSLAASPGASKSNGQGSWSSMAPSPAKQMRRSRFSKESE